MNVPPLPNRPGVSFKIQAVTGIDSLWYLLLSRSSFATHVALKLKKQKRYVDWFELPDGSQWDRYGSKLEEEKS